MRNVLCFCLNKEVLYGFIVTVHQNYVGLPQFPWSTVVNVFCLQPGLLERLVKSVHSDGVAKNLINTITVESR